MKEDQIQEFVESSVPKNKRGAIQAYLKDELVYKNPGDARISGESFIANRDRLDRINLDPAIQVPREDLLRTLKREELGAIVDTYSHFLASYRGTYTSSFSLLAVGSVVDLERKKEVTKLFEEHGLTKDDYITEHACNWGSYGDKRYEFANRSVKIEDILNETHNDIDLLISPDTLTGESYKSISYYQDRFFKYLQQEGYDVENEVASQSGRGYMQNPKTGELVTVKGVEYLDNTVKITALGEGSRPIHVYFKNTPTDIKIKNDLAHQHKFSVLLRRNNLTDLQCAIWNGVTNDVFENPLYVEK